MAATFVGQTGVNARSDDCAVHTDCIAGDLVVAVAADASLETNLFDSPADPLEDGNNGTNIGFGSSFDIVADNTYIFTATEPDRHRTRTFAFRGAGGVTSRDPTFEGADTTIAWPSFSGGTGRYLLVGYTTSSSVSRSAAPSGWTYALSQNFIIGLLSDAELSSYDGSVSITLGASVFKGMQVFCILPGGYELAVDPGAYNITGATASLEFGRLLSAASGSYLFTGQNATLQRALSLLADPASYLMQGQTASLEFGRLLDADPGSYSVDGQTAGLNKGLILSVDPGSYSFSGAPASLIQHRLLAVDPGSYLIQGATADLNKGATLVALPGAYTITGSPATLIFFPPSFDGLKYFHGTTQELAIVAVEDAPPGDRLTIHNDGVEYAIYLVDITDPFASTIRINTNDGVKAIRLRT